MRRRGARIGALAALTLSALWPLLGHWKARAQQTPAPIYASVGAVPTGQAMEPGFVGVSLEYGTLHLYTGRDPRAVNPVLVRLLRNLTPGQTPVLRIGGDSTDSTWWPILHEATPHGVRYALSSAWLRVTRTLAATLGARLIMGVNLASGRPAVATAEARAFLRGIGPRYVEALEIGNEPDVYGQFPWYRDRRGQFVFSRSSSYSLPDFIGEFSRWSAALPKLPTAGPAFAELTWMAGLDQFLADEPGLGIVTIHRYPLRACIHDPASPLYTSIPHLLSDQAASGLAQGVAPYVALAHSRGLVFRVDELNSASCSGRRGVSNTFAAALWILDTLFNLASVGVDGVNVHSIPGAGYELFTFSRTHRRWRAFVHPEYYGMLMFEQAFPPGAQLLPTTVSGEESTSGDPLKVWATRAPDGHTRIVLINEDPSAAHLVQVQPPSAGPAALEWLRARTVSSTSGVTLGGRTFGAQTQTGSLGRTADNVIISPNGLGSYSLTLPPGSAALLTS